MSLAEEDKSQRRNSGKFKFSRRLTQNSVDSDSNPSEEKTHSRRPRGFSRSSARSVQSDAISFGTVDHSAAHASRKSNADDSDVESSNGSLGQTEEDVWFPIDNSHRDDVKLSELDQLLNLSSESDVDRKEEEEKEAPPRDETQAEIPTEEPKTPLSRQDSNSTTEENRTNADGEDVSNESLRFSFFASKMDATVHAPDLGSLVDDNESFTSLFNDEHGAWWLDCYCPNPLEMKILARAFGIHPLTAEDIRMGESREKFDMFRKYYFVVYNTFENDPKEENFMEPIQFYLVVFSGGVLSFHFHPVTHCRNVRKRMRQLRDYVHVTSDWIAYAVIDDITDSFAPVIHGVEHEVDWVEENVYVHSHEADTKLVLARLGESRRKTMMMMRLLSGKSDVVRGFSKRCSEAPNAPSEEMALYLGDILDHLATMYQSLSSFESILGRSHFNYMGLLQMEFVDSSNRMTTVLGKVTVLGTILVPMNLVTGMFGMNVKVPGQDGSNLGWFFGILGFILFLIVSLSVLGTLYFRHISKS